MGYFSNGSLFPSSLLSTLPLLLLLSLETHAQSTLPRWGQSTILLSPSSSNKPTLLISSGHSYTPGQTLTSSPLTGSLLSLDLSAPISDLENPPWREIASEGGPMNAWGGLVALSNEGALGFGGDSTGDPRVPIQTERDSSWTLKVSLSNSTDQVIEGVWKLRTLEPGWVNQPERRESFYSTSAMSIKEGLSRSWIYGGLRADGSGLGFNEMWEMRVGLEDQGMEQVEWAKWEGEGGPKGQGLNDGTAVLVPSSNGGLPTIYMIGGVETSENTLVSFNEISTFTPGSSLGTGSWSTFTTTTTSTSTNVPQGRKGHSALYLGSGKIWLGGGRSLDGSLVWSDSWILDLGEKSWTRMSDLKEGVWGASAVVLGQTVLMSFGYGLNSPASTNLGVWNWSNDTWLNSYTPSYQLAVPTNPKASSGSSSSSSANDSTGSSNSNSSANQANQNETPTNPKAHSDDPSSSSSPSSSSPDSNSSSSSPDSNSSSPDWVTPGSPSPPAAPDSDNPSSSSDSSDKSKSGHSPSKSLVAGAIAGSLLGALAIVAVGVYGVKRRKRNQGYRGGSYGGFTGDEEGVGMVEKSGEEKGSASGFREFFSPKVGGGTGVGLGVAGMGKRRRISGVENARERRWDMLNDEEEEEARGGLWTRFDAQEEREQDYNRYSHLDQDRRTPSTQSTDSSRIGVGIWGGGGGLGGLGRSESVRSGTSYLGGNLGGFLGTSIGGGGDKGGYGEVANGIDLGGMNDPTLTPIAEWEEDEDEDEDEGTMESGVAGGSSGGTRSTETHQTRTTLSTSDHSNSNEAASIRQATRHQIVRPFSPGSTSSLYGSGFATPTAFTLPQQGITRSTSSSSSLFLSPGQGAMRRDNSSWWSRLKHHQQASTEIPTATAFEAIRDPAPVPTFDSNPKPRDPFSDPTSSSSDEHGQMSERAVRGVHDRSISSNVSEVTATSSILEERMRGMDVVQRMRSVPDGGSEGSNSSIGGGSTQVTPTLPQNPFADPGPTPGSVIFAGSQFAFSPRSTSPPPPLPTRSTSNDFPLLPVIPTILPPTPTHATPPSSPRKSRLMGPRPQPSSPLPSIARSGSVKDLVADIERRASLPHSPSLPTSPTKPSSRRSKTTHEGGRKVEHGLVKKPKLYVANP